MILIQGLLEAYEWREYDIKQKNLEFQFLGILGLKILIFKFRLKNKKNIVFGLFSQKITL